MARRWVTVDSANPRLPDSVKDANEFVYDVRRQGTPTTATTLQAACTLVAAAGGGVVELPHDTAISLSAARVNIGSNVRVRGDRSTVITSTHADGVFLFTGNNSAVEGVTIDSTGAPSTHAPINAFAGSPLIGNAVRRCRIVNGPNTGGNVRVASAYDGFTVEDCEFESCASGISINPAAASKALRIAGNRFNDVGLVNIQVYGTSLYHTGVTVDDNRLSDFDTPSTAIPIEVTGSQEVAITNNRIMTAASRGVSTGACEGLVIANNTMNGQTSYAVELNGGKRISVVGNVAKDCASLFDITGGDVEDLAVIGNVYKGSGLSGAASTTWVMNIRRGKRMRIASNVITDWQYLGGAIRVGNGFTTEDVVVDGNEFHITDANTLAYVAAVASALRTRICRNRVVVNRNLAAADDNITVIQINVNATNVGNHAEDNDVIYLGTVSAATNHAALGHRNTGAGACAGLRIARNKVIGGQIGIYSNTTSTDAEIVDNETRSCATADTIPTTLAVRRAMREHEASAAPTSGTWRVGDRVWNTAAAAAGVPGWVCTTAGTPGTWKAMAVLAA